MKQLKMLAFSGLTLLLAMAFFGAPSAMAEETEPKTEPTELCKADETTCKAENVIKSVDEATPELKKAVLLTSSGNVECHVLFSGEVPYETTNGPVFVSGKFTYTSCLLKGVTCEVTEVSKGSSLIILREGKETGTAEVTSEFSVKCGASIGCTFTEENLLGTAKGPLLSTLTHGEVSFKEAAIKKTAGTLCPKESKLDMTTTPSIETFLSQGHVYCAVYENSRGRWASKISSTACTMFKGAPQMFQYERVTSEIAGLTMGSMLCVWDEGLTFYLTQTGTTCGNKDATALGKFELAEVS